MKSLAYALAGRYPVTVKFPDGTVVELSLRDGFRFLDSLSREGYETLEHESLDKADAG